MVNNCIIDNRHLVNIEKLPDIVQQWYQIADEPIYDKLWIPDSDKVELKETGLNINKKCSNNHILSSTICKPITNIQFTLDNPTILTEAKSSIKALKIRIYPTDKQKKFYENYFGARRYIYNRCVDRHRQDPKYGSWQSLVSEIVLNKDQLTGNLKWLSKINCNSKQSVVREFDTITQSARTNKTNGNIKHYRLSYLSKKNISQIFYIDPRNISMQKKKKLTLFSSSQKETLQTSRNDRRLLMNYFKKSNNPKETKIQKYGNKYYILLPKGNEKVLEKDQMGDVVVLDPGVRNFQSFYSPNGTCGTIQVSSGLDKIHNKLHKLKKLKNKTRGIRRGIRKSRIKIKNIASDLHWQTISYLCHNYKVILLPSFNVKQMVKKSIKRRISRKTVAKMLNLSHFTFKQRLLYKAKRLQRKVVIVNESWTSKPCGFCGTIHEKLGGNKTFECPHCKLVANRDIHAARNILLKQISSAKITF